ncbi:hypothetical protein N7475_000410 [Penicillium sp. IBT 31633x]|nr:hypothetical protein N7475_000410 [Penicillium sp. IBT 31633x]
MIITAIFWASEYFLPNGASQPRDMNYEAFLDDLQAHMQYDSKHEETHFRVPVSFRHRPLDPALPGVREIQNVRPVTCIVTTASGYRR